MTLHLQLYDSNWQELRPANILPGSTVEANLSFPAAIPLPLQIYGCSYIQYDWELLVETILDTTISNYRNRISNPNEIDFGYVNARSNNYVRERTQIHSELQQLCGSSRRFQFPNSDSSRPSNYSNTEIPAIFGANNHEFGLCHFPPNTINPAAVQVNFEQLNLKIKDFQLTMKPISRPIEEYLPIEISPSGEQEIDQFSFYLRAGVVGRTRLIIRLRVEEQAIQFGSAHQYDISSENGGYQPACGVSTDNLLPLQFAALLPPQTVCPDPCNPTPNPCNAPPGFEYCCGSPTSPGCAVP
jgi:hypothetical protein